MKRLLLPLLLVALFGVRLGAPGFWEKDEARYAQAAREMRESGDYLVPTLDGRVRLNKPPLSYWLIAASQSVFGENEFAARLPSAIAGVLTSLLVLLVGRRLAGSAAGALAALVYATSVYPAGMGRLTHPDSILVLFVTAALAFFYLSYRSGFERRSLVLLSWLAMGLGFLVKGPHAVLLPVLVIFVFLLAKRDLRAFRRLMPLRGFLLAIAPVAIWAALVVIREGSPILGLWWDETVGRATGGKSYHPEPPYYFVKVVLGGLSPWILWVPALVERYSRKEDRPAGGLFLLVWGGVIFVFFSLLPNKASGYVLPCMPPLAVATGIALAEIRKGRPLLVTGAIAALAAAGGTIALFSMKLRPELTADSTATALTLGSALLTLAATGFLALRGRPRAAVAATAAGACLTLLLGFTLLAPAASPYRSTRGPGLAVRERIREGDRFINLESPRAGLVWYSQHTVETEPKLEDLIPIWDGPTRLFVFAEPDSLPKFAKHGIKPHVIWSLTGRNYIVYTNRK